MATVAATATYGAADLGLTGSAVGGAGGAYLPLRVGVLKTPSGTPSIAMVTHSGIAMIKNRRNGNVDPDA